MDSMRRIRIIAANTYRESVRDKILYNIVFLAIGLCIFSILLGQWSVFDRDHVIKSVTLSLMSITGLLISVFVGISLVQKEIQRRTVLTLLSKPMYRSEFILGKYLGLMAVVATHLTLLTGVFFLILWATQSLPEASLLPAIYLVFLEMGDRSGGGDAVQLLQHAGALVALHPRSLCLGTPHGPDPRAGAVRGQGGSLGAEPLCTDEVPGPGRQLVPAQPVSL